jgi:dUTP pyrophosphatase
MCNTVEPQLRVEFRILDDRLREWGFPKWATNWAAGLDLFACINEPLEIRPQDAPILVSAGMAFRIGDPSWCALVLPRSGLGHRKGLVLGNLVGVVDPDFDGPCRLSVWNRSRPTDANSLPLVIQPGDRIAQLVFTRTIRPAMIEVETFSERSERGEHGYGSTGD